MSDVREDVVGSATVRIAGLDAKELSLGSVLFELEGMVSDGVRAATAAVELWRGPHAETFVEEVNPFLVGLAQLAQKVREGRHAVAAWPELPGRNLLEEWGVWSAAVEVPPSGGTSAASPATLDVFAAWCQSVSERVPTLAAGVGLADVTAEVTRPAAEAVFGSPLVDTDRGRSSVLVEPEPVLESWPGDPARYVDVPDVSGRVATLTERAEYLCSFTAGVALAFRREDERLLNLVMQHPDLADELLSWWQDGVVGGESSLVILLAYFDVFDGATTGEEDGVISVEDLAAIGESRDVPPYVREAAVHLSRNPELFTLIETVNDPTQPPELDEAGRPSGDGRMSRHDVEVFLEFNDRLTALDENFDTFDTAASPGRDPDGVISPDDLAAVAEGDGEAAATAAWLLAHGPLYDRVASYHAGGGPVADITRDSLVVLAVDQQVHADSAPDAAAFVDRHLDSLLSESVGASATGEGMYALFDTALTESDQRGEVMEHVIAKVAEEGAIHNPGLPVAFANGTAANMDTIHSLINDGFDSGGENGTDSFESTHVFLRETMRDADAAEVVLNASTGYFADRLDSLADEGREFGLEETGRTLGVVTQAHANAGLSDATDSDDAATHQAAAANFLVGLIPYGEGVVGVANDFAEIGGLSFGDLVAGGSERPAAEEAARDYQYELEKVGAVAMTTHHYNEGTLERDAALTSMREHVVAEGIDLNESHLEGIFYDAEGAPRQRLSPSGMTDAQLAAFTDWANSSGGARPTGTTPATPLQNDYAHLSSGIGQANNRLNNEYGG